MDKNSDFNYNFNGANNSFYGYSPYDNFDPMQCDPNFNPMAQYEQAYAYYKYLSQAMDYKIKCKEYEKLLGKDLKQERRID